METTTEAPVSAGTLYKFYVNADDATSNGDNQSENANNIFPDAKTGTNSLSGSSTVTIEGKNYTFNKRGSNAAHVINISVPDNVTGATLYIVANSSGSGTRTLTLKDSSGAEAGTNTVAGAAGQLFSFSGLSTGAYTCLLYTSDAADD